MNALSKNFARFFTFRRCELVSDAIAASASAAAAVSASSRASLVVPLPPAREALRRSALRRILCLTIASTRVGDRRGDARVGAARRCVEE